MIFTFLRRSASSFIISTIALATSQAQVMPLHLDSLPNEHIGCPSQSTILGDPFDEASSNLQGVDGINHAIFSPK
jgi:hypothetical protein